jgi:hypothetical protein
MDRIRMERDEITDTVNPFPPLIFAITANTKELYNNVQCCTVNNDNFLDM